MAILHRVNEFFVPSAYPPTLSKSNPLARGIIDAFVPVGPVVIRVADVGYTALANDGTLTNGQDAKYGGGLGCPSNSTTQYSTTSSTTGFMPQELGSGANGLKEFSYMSVIRVGSSTVASTFGGGYGNTTATGPILSFQVGAANTNFIWYVRPSTGSGQTVTGTGAATIVDKTFVLLGTRSESNNFHRMYVNGLIDVDTTATVLGAVTFNNFTFQTVRRSGVLAAMGGLGFLTVAWNRPLTPREAVDISSNPWQIFDSGSQPIFTNAAVAAAFMARQGLNIPQAVNRASTY